MSAPTVVLAAVLVLAVARCAAHQKHAVRALLACALCGMAALAVVNLAAGYTGVSLPVNRVTAFGAVVLGLPGVILMLLLELF